MKMQQGQNLLMVEGTRAQVDLWARKEPHPVSATPTHPIQLVQPYNVIEQNQQTFRFAI